MYENVEKWCLWICDSPLNYWIQRSAVHGVLLFQHHSDVHVILVNTLHSVQRRYCAATPCTIHSCCWRTWSLVVEHSTLPAWIAWTYLISNFPVATSQIWNSLPETVTLASTVIPASIENFPLLSLLFHVGQAAIKPPSAEASKRAQCTSPGK